MPAKDEQELRLLARNAVRRQLLPRRAPNHTWGGPGSGAPCAICADTLTPDDRMFELEFTGEGAGQATENYPVHLRCFATWEFEREQVETDPDLRSGSARATLPENERHSNDTGHRK